MNQPIFVTGVERSGSTLIAKIFDICGAYTGTVTTMYESLPISLVINDYLLSNTNNLLFPDIKLQMIPLDWHDKIIKILKTDGYKDGPWLCKNSKMTQMWPVWHYAFPNARWIIVRRRTGDIIQSCIKTGYMRTFKNNQCLKQIGVNTEEEGWKWWIHQYEQQFREMIEAGVNCRVVWPERMVTGDYQQVYETLDWLGLEWNTKIVETIDPMLNKSRRKLKWH